LKRLRTLFRIAREKGGREALVETLRYVLIRIGGATVLDVHPLERRLAALVEEHGRLAGRTRQLERELESAAFARDELRARNRRLASSIRFVAWERPAAQSAEELSGSTLVSVVMAVRNREATIAKAVRSVLSQIYTDWELLIVDDGSTDGTRERIGKFAGDPRIRLFEQAPAGVSAARNRALREARGEIVTYLDSDNEWAPRYLADVVEALRTHPDRQSLYAAQLVEEDDTGFCWLRYEPFDHRRLLEENYVDLNVFAHRRRILDRVGGFDDGLRRLVDWDFIERSVRDGAPLTIPTVGCRYVERRPDSIWAQESFWLNAYRFHRKRERPIESPLRVLVALWHYPQLTESYVRAEILCMKRWGVEVEVFSEIRETAAPYEPEVPVHHGSLDEAIGRFRPHLVHVHWLNFVERFRDAAARAGLPVTARGHSFEFTPELVAKLQGDPVVASIYLFPHLVDALARKEKVLPVRSAFRPDVYGPGDEKDRRLVIRVGTSLPTKDLPSFFRIARLCPDHRFVLVLGRATHEEAFTDRLVAENEALGNPVEICVNLTPEEIAPLLRRAGIFLHTFDPGLPYGMPMAIGEAMASGCWIVARRCPGSAEHVGDAGALYDTPEEAAALVRQTLAWSEERWKRAQLASIEWAYERHADSRVLRPILEDWIRIARGRVLHDFSEEPLDDRFRPLVDYLVDLRMSWHRHHDGSLIAHQIGVGRGLLAWGSDLDVCHAGIVHSIYGTEKGGTGYDLSRREELRKIVGERAEYLAYLNCALTRFSFDEALERGRPPWRFRSRFSGEEIELPERDFDDLCRIHLCDWLEQVPRCGQWQERREQYARMAHRLGGAALAAFERVYSLEGTGPRGIAASDERT
jgi:glycosyltransferase involved in cell wall biosynthesis